MDLPYPTPAVFVNDDSALPKQFHHPLLPILDVRLDDDVLGGHDAQDVEEVLHDFLVLLAVLAHAVETLPHAGVVARVQQRGEARQEDLALALPHLGRLLLAL